MTNIQQILDKISQQKFAKLSSERVGHYYGDNMVSWRKSELNRIKNQGRWRENQKLTPFQAEEIRRLHWEEDWSLQELTNHFGIAQIGVRKILNNKRFYNKDTKYVGIKFRKTNGVPTKVFVHLLDTNEYLTFDSLRSGGKYFGVTGLTIQNCVLGKQSTIKGKKVRVSITPFNNK